MRFLLFLALGFQLWTVAEGKTASQRSRDSSGNQSGVGGSAFGIFLLVGAGFLVVIVALLAVGLLSDFCKKGSSEERSGDLRKMQIAAMAEDAAAKPKTLETVGASASDSAELPGAVAAASEAPVLRKTQLAAMDTTGDGKVDTVGYDTTGDGRIDRVERDTTGDGKADTVEVDHDGDGQTDATYRIN